MRIVVWIAAVLAAGALFVPPYPRDFSVASALEQRRESNASDSDEPPTAKRIRRGLQVLYDFNSSDGPFIRDRSGVGRPANLRIMDTDSIRRSKGRLELLESTLIRSDKPVSKVINSMMHSGEVTLEAWVEASKNRQEGPARILTLSSNASNRNFTLGQDGKKLDVRLRTTSTSNNGIPSLSAPAKNLAKRPTHVVYTRDRSGQTAIYIDGQRVAEREISGTLAGWDGRMRLALGNELDRKRPWLGTFHLVAIYNRDLSAREVKRNYNAGAAATSRFWLVKKRLPPNQQLFETKVASIFAQHCLECHDSVSKNGELDLSRKRPALAGGQSGTVIAPGKPDESLLWQLVDSDEMPQEREPLSAEEKEAIKKWLANGATWSLDLIDPAIYAHEQRDAKTWVQRLTVDEYIETVRGAVGVDITEEARRMLPRDLRADGFRNTAYNLDVDLAHVEAYAELAEVIVSRMDISEFASQFTKPPRKLTRDEMRGAVKKIGYWLLRGPLSPNEIESFLNISSDVVERRGNYEEAVRFIVEAMLQSPRFIYRIEDQRGDGRQRPIYEYELASRISYILWGAPPDEELMRAAADGELADPKKIRAQVGRMLNDERAVKRSLQFVYQWLNLGRLDNLQPSRTKFPNWDDQLAKDMREESLAYFREVVWEQERPLADLLNAQMTFVTPRLAEHYGLEPKGSRLARYDVSDVPSRGGLLTHGSVLTVGGDEASMVTRGLFVLHDLLRGVVKDPPPGVDTTPKPTRSGLSQRGIAEERIANESCGGCHSRFEPLAFGLEKFDGVGAYHDLDEHGNKLRDDGEILFPGEAIPVKYESSAELMDLLAASDRVQETITWKVTQFALGRPLVQADARSIQTIHDKAQEGGGTYASVMKAIVMSELVQLTRTESDP